MNGYRVLLRPAARRDLDHIPDRICSRVLGKIGRLAANPRPPGSRKLVGGTDEWRLRAGDYRILYEIDDKTHMVLVFRIRHRREAYR